MTHESDSADGHRLLDGAGQAQSDAPVVFSSNGRVLVDSSNAELAEAYGVSTELEGESDFDVAVIGAGPGGLAAAVYASSEGLRTLVVERESIGGQAGSSSLIRNYLGFSRAASAAAELAQRAFQQAWVFGTRFLLMREVVHLRPDGERLVLSLSEGSEATAGAAILATGVSYRRLGIPSLEALTGAGVFYGASVSEGKSLTGEDVYVVGGATRQARQPCTSPDTPAASPCSCAASRSRAACRATCSRLSPLPRTSRSHQHRGGWRGGEGRLEQLGLRDRGSGEESTVEAAALFVLIGARPHTGWLPPTVERDERGFYPRAPTAG